MTETSLSLTRINPIVKETESSPMRQMMKMMEDRSDLINLSAGEANFDAPAELIELAVQSMQGGRNKYTSTSGIPQVRSAVADFLKARTGVAVDPEKNILITVGGMEAIFLATRLLIEPGDQVLLPDPGWGVMQPVVRRLGGQICFYPLELTDTWRIGSEPILEQITNRTKLIVINTPSNPTGATLSREGFAAVLEKARHYGVFVLSDEVYHNYLYEGEHVSALSVGGLDHVIVVNSFSKSFAVTGWRLGYAVAHPWVISQMSVYKETISLCSFSIGQWAMAGYLPGSGSYLDHARELCRKNMEKMVARLNDLPGVSCPRPQGGIYVFPAFADFDPSAQDLFRRLLDSGVAVVPGPFFGDQGKGRARLMFAAAPDIIDRALDRIEAALAA